MLLVFSLFPFFFREGNVLLSSDFLVALERNDQALGKQLSQEIWTVTTSADLYGRKRRAILTKRPRGLRS